MFFVFIVMALAEATIAIVGLRGLSLSNQDLGNLYEDRLLPVSKLAHLNELMHESLEQLIIAVISRPSPQNAKKYIDRVEQDLAEIENIAKDYQQHVATADEKSLFSEWTKSREALIGKGLKPAIASLKAQDFNEAEDTILGVATTRFAVTQQLFDKIIAEELQITDATRGQADRRYRFTLYLTAASLLLVLALCFGAAIYVNRSIVAPVASMTAVMKRLAGGDSNVTIPALGRGDEIGEMAQAVSVFRESKVLTERLQNENKMEQDRKEQRRGHIEQSIAGFEVDIRGTLEDLAAAAADMRNTSLSMSGNAKRTSLQSDTVSSAANKASENVQVVAAATEELSSSIGEISSQVNNSATIAKQAVDQVNRTNSTIRSLSEKADKIGDVLQLINAIAAQTNLLALNATIEAARAGEAGRGFAVVAAEVKSLAGQTAKATEEISVHVGGVQNVTGETVSAMRDIGLTIEEINRIAAAIAAAIEQQGAATQKIAKNIQQAAHGTSEVSTHIADVNVVATEAEATAQRVEQSADQLGGLAELLRTKTDAFLASIRAA